MTRRLTALLLALTPAFARWSAQPSPGVLWEEDFRSLALVDAAADSGWRSTGGLSLGSAAGGTVFRAAPGGRGAALTRYVPFDLETARTPAAFPFLILEVAESGAEPWAGITLANDDDPAQRALVRLAAEPGRWVIDLRRAAPHLLGRSGQLPLSLTAYGAAEDAAGPATVLGRLALAADAQDRIDLDASALDAALHPGDHVSLTVRLAKPAEGVACDFALAGPPRRAVTLDGRSQVELTQADQAGRVWRAQLPVTDQATRAARDGASLHVTAHVRGGALAVLHTAAWFALATAEAMPLRRTLRVAAGVAPRLDGRLDDAAWRTAPVAGGFLLTDPPAPCGHPTDVRACSDGESLYLGLIAHEDDVTRLKARERRRDGRVTQDDCLEVSLAPRDGSGESYHFAVNAAGVVSDARCDGGRIDLGWDAPWRVAVARGEGHWSAELAIPFAALGLGDGSTPEWGFNVLRDRYAGEPREVSAWSVPAAALGTLAGLPLDPHAYALQLGAATLTTQRAADGYTALLRLPLVNASGTTARFTATAMATSPNTPASSEQRDVTLPPGGSALLEWSLPLKAEGTYDVRWWLEAAAAPKLRAVGQRAFEVAWRPVAVRWLKPHYRDSIFPTQAANEVTAEMAVLPGLGDHLRLTAELRGRGELLAAQALDVKDLTAAVTFPAADLPPGDYELRVGLRDGDRELGTVVRALHKLPPSRAGEVRFDERGVCLVQGRPFLPLGAFADAAGAGDLAAAHANLRVGPADGAGELRVVVPLAEVVAGAPESRSGPLSEATRARLATAVGRGKENPHLLAWLLADEAADDPHDARYLRDCAALVRSLDPYHPCLLAVSRPDELARCRDAADAFLVSPDGALTPAATVELLDCCGEVRPAPILWLAPKLAGLAPAALRCLAYVALCEGARGLLLPPGEVPPDALPALAAELERLHVALLAPEIPGVRAPAGLVTRLARLGTGLVLVAANPTERPIEGRIEAPALGAAAKLSVVGEGREVMVAAGAITDQFEAMAVHVYVNGER